ncbi:MAG: hypothetical protein WD060_08550 [Pirellulales bacterium]
MPGEVILLGRGIPKEAEAAVFFSIDGSEPKPLPADPHNRPLASDLAPSRHTIKILVKPFSSDKQGDAAAAVKIHYVGAAGVAVDRVAVDARGSAASHPPPLRLGAQPPRASPGLE